jgi:hypothetical protein
MKEARFPWQIGPAYALRARIVPTKGDVRQTIAIWALLSVTTAFVLVRSIHLAFGHVPESALFGQCAITGLPLGPALARRNLTTAAKFRHMARTYAIAGGAYFAMIGLLRGLRLL